jgi:hypothetical protein
MQNGISQPFGNSIQLSAIIENSNATEFIRLAQELSLIRDITQFPSDYMQENVQRIPRLGFLFETQALEKFRESRMDLTVKENFWHAFSCWRSIINLPSTDCQEDYISSNALHLLENELVGEPFPAYINLAFRLAVTGLLSDRSSEVRLELKKFNLHRDFEPRNWAEKVRFSCFLAFTYLCRKQNGWEDVDRALNYIDTLKDLQSEYEDSYIKQYGEGNPQVKVAYELVGYYNLAQIITLTAFYLKNGTDTMTRISDRIDRYKDQALEAFNASESVFMIHLTKLLWAGCWKLSYNSIWTHVNVLGETPRKFARLLSDRGRPNPVIELWPSQQEALRKNLLDPYRRAILVEMPTSAGKTLLAKFSIIQTKALNPNGKIMYIVPTRALVNQVTIDLRSDFANFDPRIVVEQAVPAFELNPTEERLLAGEADILVTTPEKLDLLIRKEHPVTRDIALVIADEAHNISDRSRGARLELLLGTLKRERVGARFLLLSPFLPNDTELVGWLGEDQALPPIGVDWKPSRTVVGLMRLEGNRNKRAFFLKTVPASKTLDITAGKKIRIADKEIVDGPPSKERYTLAGVKVFVERGAILILCRGRGTALKRAKQIADTRDRINENNAIVKSVCRFLEIEQGPTTPLIELLYKGVAYHHSGLSQETRLLIEGLIKKDLVKVVCGTTTLAQGVNFPISTVIIESLVKGSTEKITFSDFWNVAGRAGRALVDTTGIVLFPTPNVENQREVEEFLRGEAEEISSQLSDLLNKVDEIAGRFSLYTVFKYPQLSSLMQFLAHALKVAGEADLAGEVEDLLRASLIYHQAGKYGNDAQKKLIMLCRTYLESIKGNKGLVQIADQTGFATPSVLKLLREKAQYKDLSDYDSWKPELLFNHDVQPLTRRIEAIAELPEIQLGRGTSRPFNPTEVATILNEWVNGMRLDEMATRHPIIQTIDPGLKEAEFGKYLFSNLIGKASWGIGALEGLYLSGIEEEKWNEVGYVPSMLYFGVSKKEAVWFRMVGAPRFIANGLADLWVSSGNNEPSSHQQLRNWIDSLNDDQWQRVIPRHTNITSGDVKLLWKELMI